MAKSVRVKKTTAKRQAKEKPAAKQDLSGKLTSKQFYQRLLAIQSDQELKKIQRYFKTGKGEYSEGDKFIGVKMGSLFALAREFSGMPIAEIEKMLNSPIHEMRAGALSLMDKESRNKKTSESRRKDFFQLYVKRHDRVNNWDLVDLGCLHMTGSYLFDKPRDILYRLARSRNLWERRSAILSTCYFIRQGELDDTYQIAEMLVRDKEDLVHKATGWMLRFAGTKDRQRLVRFLDKYAATLPRVLLRNALEHFPQKEREKYLAMKNE